MQHMRPRERFPRILDAIQRGDPKAAEDLLPLVHDELKRNTGTG